METIAKTAQNGRGFINSDIQFTKVYVTPELAKSWMQLNKTNRIVRLSRVDRYARLMSDGLWMEDTGETIKFSRKGSLIDGQHRLLAVIKSGISVGLNVIYNLDENVFVVIDSGDKRTSSDNLHIRGVKNSNVISGIICMYARLKSGIPHNNGRNSMSSREVVDEYENREGFWYSVYQKANSWYNSFGHILIPSVIGATYALFFEIDQEAAPHFMNQLATGANIDNNTIVVLRQMLIRDRTSIKKFSPTYKLAYIIKAWNYFREGKEVKILRYQPEIEDFPVAI